MKLNWSSKEIELNSDHTYSIGRHAQNDIVLAGRSISRQHARIEAQDGSFFIINLSRTNPISVAGAAISFGAKAPLTPNVQIKIGRFTLLTTGDNPSLPGQNWVRCQNGHVVNGRLKICPHCGVFLDGANTTYLQGE